MFVLTLLWRFVLRVRDAFVNPMVLLINIPIACAIGAFAFAKAHGLAYGANSQLYISAFLFEFFAQAMNQLVGAFVSWIPHFVHNALVVSGLIVGISIGGYVLAGGLGFVPGKKKLKKLFGGDTK